MAADRFEEGLSLVVDESVDLSDEHVRRALEAQLATLGEPERVSFQRAVQTIGRGAQQALPGIVQGATTGAAAGPWGALIGGAAGGALSLAGQASRPARPAAAAPGGPGTSTAVPPAHGAPPTTVSGAARPAFAGVGHPAHTPATVPPATPTANQAAAHLLRLAQDPRMLQALGALVTGPVGRREIPVGTTGVAPTAFLNLLSVLAQQAAQQAEEVFSEVSDAYLRGPDGDVASPVERARVLWEQLEAEADPTERASTAEQWLLATGLAEIVDL